MSTQFTSDTFTPVQDFSREVQIDREEFLRQLPGAIEPRPFSVDGDLVTIPEGNGHVCIKMTPLANEHLGKLDLPMMRVDYAFTGLSEDEIGKFMETYRERTFRGGGGM